MRRTVALGLGIAIHLAGCQNAPGEMSPGVTSTGGTGAAPTTGAGGSAATAPTMSGTPAMPTTHTMTKPTTPTTGASGAGALPAGAAGMLATTTPAAGSGGAVSVGAAGAPAQGAAGAMSAAGAGGAMAAAGSAAAQGGSGSVPETGYKPKCLAKGAELALIGDSWVHYDLGEVLAPRLAKRAQQDGALPAGAQYNDQAVAGTSLANGGLGLIPDQWAPAKAAAQVAGTSVKFVVMDGGGNDVLLGNMTCLDNGKMRDQDPACQKTVADATAVARMLEQKMKMDGVGQILYYYYPHVPAGGWDVLDYALPMAKATCEGMNDENFQCYFVDTRDTFQGAGNDGVAMAQLILSDGIHPNAMGDELLADLLWKTMKEKCMAQSQMSGMGCCTP
jgi:hypothetical protein